MGKKRGQGAQGCAERRHRTNVAGEDLVLQDAGRRDAKLVERRAARRCQGRCSDARASLPTGTSSHRRHVLGSGHTMLYDTGIPGSLLTTMRGMW